MAKRRLKERSEIFRSVRFRVASNLGAASCLHVRSDGCENEKDRLPLRHPMNLQVCWGLLKDTGRGWSEDRVPRLAAALAYFTILSAAPLLVIVLAIAGIVFHQDQGVGQRMVEQVSSLVGEQGGAAIQTMIEHASQPSSSIPAMVIGAVVLLLGASGVFVE